MNNNWSSNNRILTKETDLIIFETHVRVSKWIRHQISQVAQMSLFLERSTVVFTERIVMRSCSCASFCQVSEFVNMNSVLTVWIKALNWTCNLDWSCGILLTERNYTPSFWVVRVQNANGISDGLWSLRLIHEIRNWAGCASKSQTEFSQHYQKKFIKGLIIIIVSLNLI